jgi:hypothetical protein
MSFIDAMCLATSSSTFGLTVGSHSRWRSSFSDFAISVGCFCRLFPPNRNAIVGLYGEALRMERFSACDYILRKRRLRQSRRYQSSRGLSSGQAASGQVCCRRGRRSLEHSVSVAESAGFREFRFHRDGAPGAKRSGSMWRLHECSLLIAGMYVV